MKLRPHFINFLCPLLGKVLQIRIIRYYIFDLVIEIA